MEAVPQRVKDSGVPAIVLCRAQALEQWSVSGSQSSDRFLRNLRGIHQNVFTLGCFYMLKFLGDSEQRFFHFKRVIRKSRTLKMEKVTAVRSAELMDVTLKPGKTF